MKAAEHTTNKYHMNTEGLSNLQLKYTYVFITSQQYSSGTVLLRHHSCFSYI